MRNGIPASKPDGGYDIAEHIRSNTTRGNFVSGSYSRKLGIDWGTSEGEKSGIVYVICAGYYPGKQIDTGITPEIEGAPTIDAVGTLEKHQSKIKLRAGANPLNYARASQEVLYMEGVDARFIQGAYIINTKGTGKKYTEGGFVVNKSYKAKCQ